MYCGDLEYTTSEEYQEYFADFNCFGNVRSELSRGGVLVCFRRVCNFSILKVYKYTDVTAFIIDGIALNLQENVLLLCVYVAPEGSPLYHYVDENDGIIRIENILAEILSRHGDLNIIIMGDLNARIGSMPDFIENDTVEYVINDAYPADDFNINRNTRDRKINKFGFSLQNLCCAFNIHILNGRVELDLVGEYTCVTYAGQSVGYYIITSTEVFAIVKSFKILTLDASDHFPIMCSFQVKTNTTDENKNTNYSRWTKHKFKTKDPIELENHWQNECYKYTKEFDQCVEYDIDQALDHLNNLIQIFTLEDRNNYKTSRAQPDWWEEKCMTAKQIKFKFFQEIYMI